jgi:nicotinamidase/pyrazinamidase
MGKILIIVDPQYDFINGSLPVKGAVEAMDSFAKWLKDHKKEFSTIVITADWHPISHCSFEINNGIWPVHCLQHSHGAAIYQPILETLNDVDYYVLEKGIDEDHEEYSHYEVSGSWSVVYDAYFDVSYIIFTPDTEEDIEDENSQG